MSNKQIYINQDEIAFYLKDVRAKTVLTPKREKELAKIMLNPDSTEEEKEKVHTELIEGNLRFVISVEKD